MQVSSNEALDVLRRDESTVVVDVQAVVALEHPVECR